MNAWALRELPIVTHDAVMEYNTRIHTCTQYTDNFCAMNKTAKYIGPFNILNNLTSAKDRVPPGPRAECALCLATQICP